MESDPVSSISSIQGMPTHKPFKYDYHTAVNTFRLEGVSVFPHHIEEHKLNMSCDGTIFLGNIVLKAISKKGGLFCNICIQG